MSVKPLPKRRPGMSVKPLTKRRRGKSVKRGAAPAALFIPCSPRLGQCPKAPLQCTWFQQCGAGCWCGPPAVNKRSPVNPATVIRFGQPTPARLPSQPWTGVNGGTQWPTQPNFNIRGGSGGVVNPPPSRAPIRPSQIQRPTKRRPPTALPTALPTSSPPSPFPTLEPTIANQALSSGAATGGGGSLGAGGTAGIVAGVIVVVIIVVCLMYSSRDKAGGKGDADLHHFYPSAEGGHSAPGFRAYIGEEGGRRNSRGSIGSRNSRGSRGSIGSRGSFTITSPEVHSPHLAPFHAGAPKRPSDLGQPRRPSLSGQGERRQSFSNGPRLEAVKPRERNSLSFKRPSMHDL
jgi:hypothetical protein